MSQKSVEIFIGKLVTDEDFRLGFAADPDRAVQQAVASGAELTRTEAEGLRRLDVAACEAFADAIDPRLQRASLKSDPAVPRVTARLAKG